MANRRLAWALLPLLSAASIIFANQLSRLVALSSRRGGGGGGGDGREDDDNAPRRISGTNDATNATAITSDGDTWELLPWSLPRVPPIHRRQSSAEFMEELNRLKRNANISLPWDDDGDGDGDGGNEQVSLPTPIISLNLPKSATLTLYEYFKCGGYTSAHTFIPSSPVRIGDCMRDNFLAGTPPFEGCDADNLTGMPVEFYSDVGIPEPRCFYSSLHDGGLDHIAEHYPNATIVIMPRDFEDWYGSVLRWGKGRLLGRWRKVCKITGSVGTCVHEDEGCWRDFYEAHTRKVREFARSHLHLTYVELGLDAETPSLLESYTGISSECFMHCVPGKPKDPNIDLRTYKKCRPTSS